MVYAGAGTRSSPIALDDSEDEVVQALSFDQFQTKSLSPTVPHHDMRQSQYSLSNRQQRIERKSSQAEKKRKRAHSIASQDSSMHMPRAGPSRVNPLPGATLEHRLSQPKPQAKKAKKQKNKLRTRATEETRTRHLDWLNNANPFASGAGPAFLQTPAFPYSWPYTHQFYDDFMPMLPDPRSYQQGVYDLEDTTFYDNMTPYPLSPSPPLTESTSNWVSSMAMMSEPLDSEDLTTNVSRWSPLSTQVSLPPPHPPPPVPPPVLTPIIPQRSFAPPSKAPEQPAVPIGMNPDQDPNSKHGLFHFTDSMKDTGSEKGKGASPYIPNPSRTLVMEQLPKTHRNVAFIREWSQSACGAHPVHMFIETDKALLEFATAELARKAWASPKLGKAFASLEPRQRKAVARVDHIKVWWYRVHGVGAGAGVGEIEEGEIEGENAVAEPQPTTTMMPTKETKKERKARLAKEREAKQQALKQQEGASKSHTGGNTNMLQSSALTSSNMPRYPVDSRYASQSLSFGSFPLPPSAPTSSFASSRYAPPSHSQHMRHGLQHAPVSRTAYGASIPAASRGGGNDDASIASSGTRSVSPEIVNPLAPTTSTKFLVASTSGQGDDLDDYGDVDMDMDVDVDDMPPSSLFHPPQPTSIPPALPPPFIPKSAAAPHPASRPPIHHSLPARPVMELAAELKRPTVPKLRMQTQTQKASIPAPLATAVLTKNTVPETPIIHHSSVSQPQARQQPVALPISSATSVSTKTIPRPAPGHVTSVSDTTRNLLMARQLQLQESIARSKVELAATASGKKVSTGDVQMQTLKPSMDLGSKQAMEDRLRKLVLESKSKRAAANSSSAMEPDVSHASSTTQTISLSSSTVSNSTSSHSLSLEDLAVNFITETIHSARAQPLGAAPTSGTSGSASSTSDSTDSASTSASATPPPPTPAAPVSAVPPMPLTGIASASTHATSQNTIKTSAFQSSSNPIRSEWAAKQKLLEQHISDSKTLMDRLSNARSKEEKDLILKMMRENNRIYKLEEKGVNAAATSVTSSTTTTASNSQTTSTSTLFRWPDSHQDAGILILSDDEE